MIKLLVSIKAAVIVAMMALSFGSGQASAGINLPSKCKLPHIKVHWGKALKKSWAQGRARAQWQRRARRVHGWSYRKWSNAYKRNSSECHKSGRWWKCAAGAYACKG
ncbi:MAG: hypothetical protein ACRBBN_15095 [Methyloligellaceae bacterium]